MKTVILCGGRGTRLDELGKVVPKALVEIGGRPIISHLMQLYASYGFSDFSLCLGHLGDKIKDYFGARGEGNIRVTFQTETNESWDVSLYETGEDTNTGGRIARIANLLADDQRFFVTYGDGLADVNIGSLLEFHKGHGKLATMTTVHPRSPFGIVDLNDDGTVNSFREKPRLDVWINGGFFVFERQVLDLLDGDPVLEEGPLETLAKINELMAYRHTGFWKCMDTYKDSLEFNALWETGPPWKTQD
ncbi:MAG: NTP transferase domain-containing protein [Acidobacteria bacterium]|nr:NTP transferase domain-containing protein [Acidobacteriota bacterium]